jgi:hypothetical protein
MREFLKACRFGPLVHTRRTFWFDAAHQKTVDAFNHTIYLDVKILFGEIGAACSYVKVCCAKPNTSLLLTECFSQSGGCHRAELAASIDKGRSLNLLSELKSFGASSHLAFG